MDKREKKTKGHLLALFCVLAGAAFLGEPVSPAVVLGAALTVAGVWISSRPGKEEP